MIKRSRLLLGLVLIVAALLTFFKIPIASSQGISLVSAPVEGDLPLTDPDSELWNQASAVDVPLSAQNVSKPFLLDSKIKSLTARSIQNGSQIAFLVKWADETQNDSLARVQDFRDAVALQFPLAEGQPFFCMGQQGGNVNLWHWKADWQKDLVARQDLDTQYANMYTDQYPFADPTGRSPLPPLFIGTSANNIPWTGADVLPVERHECCFMKLCFATEFSYQHTVTLGSEDRTDFSCNMVNPCGGHPYLG